MCDIVTSFGSGFSNPLNDRPCIISFTLNNTKSLLEIIKRMVRMIVKFQKFSYKCRVHLNLFWGADPIKFTIVKVLRTDQPMIAKSLK